jgi:lipid-A-disaccharide synthase-like uncharacterized protein
VVAPHRRAIDGAGGAGDGARRVTTAAALATVAPLVVAVQVWDGFGVAAQAVFTWRMLHQWTTSEREGRSVLPSSFWSWSLLGSTLDVVYLAHRRDPVFLSGTLVNACIYARNWAVSRRARPPTSARRPWVPLAAGLLIFGAVVAEAVGPDHGLVRFDRGIVWLVVGFLGTVGWTGRFVVQWWETERTGVSHLPAAFFYVGLASAALLFAYAVSQVDWVKMAAFALTLVPYARNLALMRRHREAGPGSEADPAPPAAAGGAPSR